MSSRECGERGGFCFVISSYRHFAPIKSRIEGKYLIDRRMRMASGFGPTRVQTVVSLPDEFTKGKQNLREVFSTTCPAFAILPLLCGE
jgi:hypothetical protein